MVNLQKKENIIREENLKRESTFPVFLLEYKNISPNYYWYKGIITEEDTTTEDNSIKILDKGDALEFILPKATALFAEILIRDIKGNLVWKTQTLNKNIVLWYKQTITGKKVPSGKYYLQVKQGEMVLKGIAII
ncbi:MAG: hypothetical protein N2053_04010 [Chitinispirillaceae bacterium]|nr:hypothetical protein [Chitinispirillaceae bacterium]